MYGENLSVLCILSIKWIIYKFVLVNTIKLLNIIGFLTFRIYFLRPYGIIDILYVP